MNTTSDYLIQNGILARYNGSGTEATVPEGITEIAPEAFLGCTRLLKIAVPDSVTVIGRNAFGGCIALREFSCSDSFAVAAPGIMLEDNLLFLDLKTGSAMKKLLQSKVRRRKQELFSVIVKNDDAAAGARFLDCLKRVRLEDLNYYIRCAGDSCAVSLSAVLLEYKNKHYTPEDDAAAATIQAEKALGLRNYTLSDWRKIFSISITQGQARIIGYKGQDSIVEIPEQVAGYPVVAVDGTFSGNGILTEITLPDSVTRIGKNAFKNCFNLTQIRIPSGLRELGEDAFLGCDGLTSLTLPATLETIGPFAFGFCGKLKEVRFSGGSAKIPTGFLIRCTALERVVLSDTVVEIGSFAFSECTRLRNISLGNHLRRIEERAFASCLSLQNLSIPDGLEEIGKNAFFGCERMTHIHLPDSLRTMEEAAFFGCTALDTIRIPQNLAMGSQVFWGCKALTDPDGFVVIGNTLFFSTSDAVELRIPYGVEVLDSHSVSSKHAQVLWIPNTVKTICDQASFCTKLKEIHIPASVKTIHRQAFSNLKSFTIYAPKGSRAARFARKNNISLIIEKD